MGVCHGEPQGQTAVNSISSCCRVAHAGFQFAEPCEYSVGIFQGVLQRRTAAHSAGSCCSATTERLQFAIATEWLAQALDQSSPDADRWWLSVALINGLCIESHGQSVHQGYHLVESIALAERPGTWHTQPEVSNANLDWNPTEWFQERLP